MHAKHHGRCPACRKVTTLTRHHIFPSRFYGRGQHNEHILLLCRSCHDLLEERIPRNQRLPDWHYLAITALFIKEMNHD